MKHLVPRLLHALVVGRVKHENQSVGVGVEMAPEPPLLGLAPNIPGSQYPSFMCSVAKDGGREEECGEMMSPVSKPGKVG